MEYQRITEWVRRHWPAQKEMPLQPSLLELLEDARQEWLAAQAFYETVVDQDLIDCAVYRLQAAERHYMYLWKQVREEETKTAQPVNRYKVE